MAHGCGFNRCVWHGLCRRAGVQARFRYHIFTVLSSMLSMYDVAAQLNTGHNLMPPHCSEGPLHSAEGRKPLVAVYPRRYARYPSLPLLGLPLLTPQTGDVIYIEANSGAVKRVGR